MRVDRMTMTVLEERAKQLLVTVNEKWPGCGAEIRPAMSPLGDEIPGYFRVHYTRDAAELEAERAIGATPYRDAAPGQTWEARVSGRVVPVKLEWVDYRPSSFDRGKGRKKFQGTNTKTGRRVDGDCARLRRRVS